MGQEPTVLRVLGVHSDHNQNQEIKVQSGLPFTQLKALRPLVREGLEMTV